MDELNLDEAPQDINKEEFQLKCVRLQAFVSATDPDCKKELIRSGSLASRAARDKPWSTLCKKSHGIPSSPRAAAVAKFRLLTGHDCLCAHLFCFNLVISPICVLCDTGQDMTAAHLDECSALNDLNCIVKRYWRARCKVLESPLPNDLMVNGLAFVK
ncbi:uncharacterized protein TNCV_1471091 [Trichonephila clavipes]|nr:uncharacterized protein TNCV_1471091 [Trichonephila clavipes]